EIADTARAFGCRESVTAALLRKHVAHPERIHHTSDDAILLDADDAARASAAELVGDRPFVIASFTDHHGTIWPHRKAYYRDLAKLCTTLADAHDVDVLLAPHAGSLDPTLRSRDQIGNEAIAEIAGSARVRSTRMITAREDVALIDTAALSLSTRYHPVVFASALAAPAVAIAPSYYSLMRMRGALGNVGLQAFVLPKSTFDLVPAAAQEAMEKTPELVAHRSQSADVARGLQGRWWDALAQSMQTDTDVSFDESPHAPTYTPKGEWARISETILPVFDEYARSADRRRELHEKDKASRAEIERLRAELESTRGQLERYRSRKVIRVLDGLKTPRQPR
uniref:polysaccharide pyruvyl transferase family protein n=1 Tax=uncultured Demequina sp. TaxID=693499 RepID=UPI0025E2B027